MLVLIFFSQSQWFAKQILRYQQRSDITYIFFNEPIDFVIQQTVSLPFPDTVMHCGVFLCCSTPVHVRRNGSV